MKIAKLLPCTLAIGAFALAGCSQLQGASGSPASSTASQTSTANTSSAPQTTQPATQAQPPTTTQAQPPATQAPPQTNAPSGGTQEVSLTPLNTDGTPAAGWTVSDHTSDQVDCGKSAGTKPGQLIENSCDPAALQPVACYMSATPTQALCIADPWKKTLSRYTLVQSNNTTANPPGQPVAVDLSDGKQCTLDMTGADAPAQDHPDWNVYWLCDGDTEIVGPSTMDSTLGLDETSSTWTATLGSASAPSHQVTIARWYAAMSQTG